LLHFPRNEYTESRYYKLLILLLAFNPVTILNSAAWGQMDSVLCLLLLLVAVYAMKGQWILSIAFYVTAVLIKPQALMLGFL
jgi:Gpi18-like mannosyltransferase